MRVPSGIIARMNEYSSNTSVTQVGLHPTNATVGKPSVSWFSKLAESRAEIHLCQDSLAGSVEYLCCNTPGFAKVVAIYLDPSKEAMEPAHLLPPLAGGGFASTNAKFYGWRFAQWSLSSFTIRGEVNASAAVGKNEDNSVSHIGKTSALVVHQTPK
nr:hypothetical protein Iba_chr12cCG3940 [Ipomoea batatas]